MAQNSEDEQTADTGQRKARRLLGAEPRCNKVHCRTASVMQQQHHRLRVSMPSLQKLYCILFPINLLLYSLDRPGLAHQLPLSPNFALSRRP